MIKGKVVFMRYGDFKRISGAFILPGVAMPVFLVIAGRLFGMAIVAAMLPLSAFALDPGHNRQGGGLEMDAESASPLPAGTADTGYVDFDAEETITRESGNGLDTPSITDTPGFVADSAGPVGDSGLMTALIPEGVEKTGDSIVRPLWLYAGLSLEQDSLARQLLRAFFGFDWNGVEKAGKKMQRLEKKHRLPPLSWLLLVGTNIMRLQNGDFERDHDAKTLSRDALKYAERGLELADPAKAPDSILATMLFITGGIKGFIATLEIDRNPVNAALSGFSARKLLSRAVELDTTIKDACMGLGLFDCVLAKAPLIVRGALAMTGNEVSLSRGLDNLCRSVQGGCYTNDIARLYLIQFLSPYLGHEVKKKRRIFRTLQRTYPRNPYYVFLEIEENLCFDPGSIARFSFKIRVRRQIAQFKANEYSSRRYAQLVRWQYRLMDPFPSPGIMPDTTFGLRGFSYYPEFLRALREKTVYEQGREESRGDRMRRLRYFRMLALKSMKTLETSPSMPGNRKSYYLWHIRDALGLERENQNGR
jgi:hypothetical protein